MFTKDHFDRYMRRQWADRHNVHLAGDNRIGVSVDELVTHSVQRNTAAETPYLAWIIHERVATVVPERDRRVVFGGVGDAVIEV